MNKVIIIIIIIINNINDYTTIAQTQYRKFVYIFLIEHIFNTVWIWLCRHRTWSTNIVVFTRLFVYLNFPPY